MVLQFTVCLWFNHKHFPAARGYISKLKIAQSLTVMFLARIFTVKRQFTEDRVV
jgi:hypothetical protein